jgi:hypothetical protein
MPKPMGSSLLGSYGGIQCEAEQVAASLAMDRLEAVRQAIEDAVEAARDAANAEPDGYIIEMLEQLAQLLADAPGDVALTRHIRAIDRALADYAENRR